MVPVRDLLIALGVPDDDEHIIWNGEERSVTAKSDSITLKMTLDRDELYRNGGKAAKFAAAPQMVDGRVYISVKEVAEALGFKAVRDASKGVLSVSSPESEYTESQSHSDEAAPFLTSAVALTGTAVEVTFNEEVEKVSAEAPDHYSIQSGHESLTVSSAELLNDRKTVKLTVPRQGTGLVYKVSAAGVKDTDGNANAQASVSFVGIATLAERESSSKPALLSAVSNSPNTVIATFNQEMDRASVEQVQNYMLNTNNGRKELNVFKAELLGNKKAVVLTTSTQPADEAFKLVVTNVRSLAKGDAIETSYNSYHFGKSLLDPLGLRPISAKAVSSSIVEIQFSEALDAGSAETASNYGIALESGRGEENLAAAKAELIEGGKKVRLLVSWGMEEGTVYKVTLNNIKNVNGIPIDRDNQYSRFFGVSPN